MSRYCLHCCSLVLVLLCAYDGARASQDQTDNDNSIGRAFDAKGMLSSLASNLMSRGYIGDAGSSQVISLNLTNLLVLVLLKALIFAAGSIGAGTWKGGYARSADGEEKLITDEEIVLFLSYLTGSPGSNGCLQSVACQQPQQAKRYAAAGDMLLKAARMLTSEEPDGKYRYSLQELQESANYGANGGDCSRYVCGVQ